MFKLKEKHILYEICARASDYKFPTFLIANMHATVKPE